MIEVKIDGDYTEEQLKKDIMSGMIMIRKVSEMHDVNKIIKDKEEYIKKFKDKLKDEFKETDNDI